MQYTTDVLKNVSKRGIQKTPEATGDLSGNKIDITKNNKKYQKIIKLLDNTPNQPSKFSIKICFETNGESHGMYNRN